MVNADLCTRVAIFRNELHLLTAIMKHSNYFSDYDN